ncbi:MAG: YhjD/YihY/BrkB family envelope integrity protein [Candidatus Sulfotelmatobacter sp.]
MSRPPISNGATARRWRLLSVRVTTLLLVVLMHGGDSAAYSVLTHEEIVDLLWTEEIQPLLLKRYPGLSESQLKQAHSYAYGGAVIQDLGYYPFGSKEFSDLVHYVRSGDFVRELLLESQDVNEYAFALGALSHYAADIAGHPAVNQSVAIEYPKLRARFGKSVRYAQDKAAHLKTEFGFDTVQVAKNRYWKTRGLAIVLTCLFGFLLVIPLGLLLVGPSLSAWLTKTIGVKILWPYVRWTVATGCTILAVELLYFVAPNVKQRFVSTLPGAVIAVSGWIGLSYLLGIYFQDFSVYSQSYGSLGVALAFCIWLYWTGFVILIGAQFNAELLHEARGTLAPEAKRHAEPRLAA